MAPTKTVEAQVVLTLGDRLSAGLNRIQARMAAMSGRLGIGRLSGAVGNLGARLSALGPEFSQSIGRLGMFSTALGVGGAGAIWGAVELAGRAQSLGDELAKTSRQLGFGAEALQEWRYAAEMQGVSVDTLEASLGIFSRRVGEAAGGNKAYLQFFTDLGIGIKDASGSVRDADELFTDAALAISKLESPAERSAAAMNLFGRSGMDMTRLFEAGADGMTSLREEARLTGHVMSQQAAEFAEIYGDNVARLQKRFEGLQTMIGVQLMPVLNDLTTQMTGWFDANQQLVRSTITEWVGKLSDMLKQLADPTSELRTGFSDLVDKVAGFYNAISPLIDRIGGPGVAAMTLLGAYIAGPLIVAFASLGVAVLSFSGILLTTPIGWIIGGLMLVGAAVYVLIQKWDEFVAYWTGMWDRIKAGFEKGFIIGVLNLLNEFNPVVHIARGLDAVLEYFAGFSLIDAGTKVITDFGNAMETAFAGVLAWAGNIGGQIVQAIIDGLSAAWSGLVDTLNAKIAELIGFLPDWAKEGLGFKVTASAPPSVAPPSAGINAPVNPYFGDLPMPSGMSQPANDVEADTVNAAVLNVPEPIIASQAQNVSAPFTSNVTVNVTGMTPAEGQSMVQRAIAAEQAKHAANVTGALND